MKSERFLKVIKYPHVSEKAAIAAEKYNEYVFKVDKDATKFQIRDAIEHLFKVKVKQVRVLNIKAKARRFGKIEGQCKAWKKAYVSLLEGQKIDVFSA